MKDQFHHWCRRSSTKDRAITLFVTAGDQKCSGVPLVDDYPYWLPFAQEQTFGTRQIFIHFS
jgi:hypothetical protein